MISEESPNTYCRQRQGKGGGGGVCLPCNLGLILKKKVNDFAVQATGEKEARGQKEGDKLVNDLIIKPKRKGRKGELALRLGRGKKRGRATTGCRQEKREGGNTCRHCGLISPHPYLPTSKWEEEGMGTRGQVSCGVQQIRQG